ncbi:MAG: zinc ribbon domain-containing protein [bacterium JZ-2024 1]
MRRLILLQKIFARNCETERALQELEQTLEQMQANVRYREGLERLSELDLVTHDLKASIRQKKLDLETARQRETDKKNLLERAGSPRELQALETQLKAAEKFREATEAELMELEEKLEVLTKEKEALTEELPRLEEAASQERKSAEARLNDLRQERDALQREMEDLRLTIQGAALREFDRLIDCRGGTAVVPLIAESRCGGCGLALPILVVEEISDNELVQCQCCGRFIVPDHAFESVTPNPTP